MKLIRDIFYGIAILILIRLYPKKGGQLLKEWGEGILSREPYELTEEEKQAILKNM